MMSLDGDMILGCPYECPSIQHDFSRRWSKLQSNYLVCSIVFILVERFHRYFFPVFTKIGSDVATANSCSNPRFCGHCRFCWGVLTRALGFPLQQGHISVRWKPERASLSRRNVEEAAWWTKDTMTWKTRRCTNSSSLPSLLYSPWVKVVHWFCLSFISCTTDDKQIPVFLYVNHVRYR